MVSDILFDTYRIHRLPPDLSSVHLQWFAAEDEGRTEEPTEHKLRKAREEGRVVKSSEFSSALILLVGIGAIALLATYLLETFLAMLKYFLTNSASIDITNNGITVQAVFSFFIRLTMPIVGVVFITALMSNLLQVGFLFTVKPITPDLTRIIPKFGKFFKRAMFSAEAGFNLFKSFVKVGLVAVLAVLNIQAELPKIMNLLKVHFYHGVELISSLAFRIIFEAGILLLMLSVLDYMFQRRLHRQRLKMSRQELKEERRMYEGDPLVKSRLRERMREIMTRNMLQAVPKADVVITNPTHFAIALEWDRLIMAAPTVVAKGADMIAHKIKEIAQDNEVPVVENKPLAQALYNEVEVGEIIPEKFYEVMATILAEIYKLKGVTEEVI
ncbi:MAG: flagellar biosynthesis protein FlhB [Spirochaetales bacterium]|nr:flagellar biosynthesis protein FlhB [Spirochaetales bacterium]